MKLKSEHVARVTDAGTLSEGLPYIVMEFLDGIELSNLIRQDGNLPVTWVVEVTLQACAALAEAHGLGIVHRDVKPSNLFVTRRVDGTSLVKLLDFGVAKTTLEQTRRAPHPRRSRRDPPLIAVTPRAR